MKTRILAALAAALMVAALVSCGCCEDTDIGGVELPKGLEALTIFDYYESALANSGSSLEKYEFADEDSAVVFERAANAEGWSELPLADDSDEAALLSLSSNAHSESDSAILETIAGIENGYAYLYDRFAEDNPDLANQPLDERAQVNSTLAVYDYGNMVLYVYNFDS